MPRYLRSYAGAAKLTSNDKNIEIHISARYIGELKIAWKIISEMDLSQISRNLLVISFSVRGIVKLKYKKGDRVTQKRIMKNHD